MHRPREVSCLYVVVTRHLRGRSIHGIHAIAETTLERGPIPIVSPRAVSHRTSQWLRTGTLSRERERAGVRATRDIGSAVGVPRRGGPLLTR